MKKSVCVFCSSSDAVAQLYFKLAEELGRQIARFNYSLVYGGGSIGLMGVVARNAQRHGSKVVGVIPEALNLPGIVYDEADELIVTRCMRERKAAMEKQGDAFIGLPGGFGTLEEILEIITLKQLQYHNKPIVLVNSAGFFNNLISLFEHIYCENFAKSKHRQLYRVVNDACSALDYIKDYTPTEFPRKWF